MLNFKIINLKSSINLKSWGNVYFDYSDCGCCWEAAPSVVTLPGGIDGVGVAAKIQMKRTKMSSA